MGGRRAAPQPGLCRAFFGPVVFATALLLFAAACGPSRETPSAPAVAPAPWAPGPVSGERALADAVAFYGLGPKVAGTEGAQRAAEWIAARLEAEGLAVSIDEFEDDTPTGSKTFRNVEARLGGGGDPRAIFAAHYDTKGGIPGFAGANDSASGVGLLLELARALKGAPEGTDFVFLFLDGEECAEHYGPRDGLHGSRRAARKLAAEGPPPPFLLFDMIGDADLRVTFPQNSSRYLARAAFAAAEAEGCRTAFGLYPGVILDDHVPFADQGFPVLDFIDFEYGSAPRQNDYWHTSSDTPDKLSAASLETVGRVGLRLATGL